MAILLENDETLNRGVEALAAADPVMARIIAEGARPAMRRREAGFAGLAGIVVAQQLSTASADAIWTRLERALGAVTADTVAGAADETLKGAGLSAPKIRTLRAVAAAVRQGDLPLDRLHEEDADAAHARLTALSGIGPWTADVYLLFGLGHADAFPAGDLALQEAARLAYGLDARPREKALAAMAEAWRPWRGVAAKVLWAHYRLAKGREGVVTGS